MVCPAIRAWVVCPVSYAGSASAEQGDTPPGLGVPHTIAAVVLAGGLGTRIADLAAGRPKAILPVAGRPFVEYLLRHLARSGVTQAVLAVGHGAEVVRSSIGDGHALGISVTYCQEREPLGTGGALAHAVQCQAASGRLAPPVIALNGDSFVAVDVSALLAFHAVHRVAVTVVTVHARETGRFGQIVMASGHRVARFAEKTAQGPGLINAGVYVMESEALQAIPEGPSSLERDILPRLADAGEVLGFETAGYFVDIGVPADYAALAAQPGPLLSALGMEAG
jgi:NDP-sugar pyrophosphorylase family protein